MLEMRTPRWRTPPRAGRLPSTGLTDVLVTGAGAAGLALAIDLARHRVDTVLLAVGTESGAATESAVATASPSAPVPLVALDVPSQEMLDDLGVLDRLIATAGGDGSVGRRSSVMSDLEPLAVPRRALLRVLYDRLVELGGRVHRGYTYAGCEPDGARLDAYLGGPDGPITVRARYLVRTDVRESAVDGARRFAVGGAGLSGDASRPLQDAYDLGWKLAAASGGAPEWVGQTYLIERIAGRVSGLTLPTSRPRPPGAAVPGDRAPDARIQTASGAASRLAALLHGPHWTLLGYGLEPAAFAGAGFAACAGLHVHAVGGYGDLVDVVDLEGELRWAYGLTEGDWVLIRPDSRIAAVEGRDGLTRLHAHLADLGLRGEGADAPSL